LPQTSSNFALGEQLGNGYATAKSQHIFRDFINAVAHVMVTEPESLERFQKRAHNPLLLAAGFDKIQSVGALAWKSAPAAGLRVAVGSPVQLTVSARGSTYFPS
jgi:hypothetical protein